MTKLEALRSFVDLYDAGNIDRVTRRDDAALTYETTSSNTDVNLATKTALTQALDALGVGYRVRTVSDGTPTKRTRQYRISLV